MSVMVKGSGGGSIKADLLWTNPNPGTATGAFNVDLNLSKYTAVIIRLRGYYDDNAYDWTIALKNWGTQWIGAHISSSQTRLNGRRVTVSDTRVEFSNGFVGASGNNDNRAAIPMKIYGIKLKGVTG